MADIKVNAKYFFCSSKPTIYIQYNHMLPKSLQLIQENRFKIKLKQLLLSKITKYFI